MKNRRPSKRNSFKPSVGPQSHPTAKPDADSIYTIQLRFHLLKSKEAEIVNTSIGAPGVTRLVAEVNKVWKPAKIQFVLESVVELPARNGLAYQTFAAEKWQKADTAGRTRLSKRSHKLMRSATPVGDRIPKGIDIFVHRYMLGAGGVWACPHRNVIYAERESNKREEMTSGTVLAHEIGHGLGLRHVPCGEGGNLMMEPCLQRKADTVSLTKPQIDAARSWAMGGAPRGCNRGEPDTND